MKIIKNVSLKPFNTFGISAMAENLCELTSPEDVQEAVEWLGSPSSDVLILGGGSNILLTRNISYVLANRIPGFDIIQEDQSQVLVKAGAGMNWHQFVLKSLELGFGGVENLSLIPGNVGASPMQNIGAYGVEIKDVFHELEAIDRITGESVVFDNPSCEFGYRESVFKNRYKDRFVITSVTYRLSKENKVNTSYGAIEQELEKMRISSPGIKDVSRAVINIRTSKLPDPAKTGNAGSFFKNPEITVVKYDALKRSFPDLPGYSVSNDQVKVPAAWLIEQCGWKGFRRGDAGCHERQPLVLVNFGNAAAKDILDLSNEIIRSVEDKFGIVLNREVNIV